MIPAGSPRPSGLDSTGWSPGQSSSPPPPTTSTHGQRISTPSATPSVAVSVAGGRNAQGQSALHITAAACNAAAISLLLDGGFDPNAEDSEGRTPLLLLCLPLPLPASGGHKAGVSTKNPGNYNSGARIACMKALMDHEADVNFQLRDSGNSALHLLVLFAASEAEGDESLTAGVKSSDPGTETRLDTAIECLNYLVKNDADISLINLDGDTPLHLAAKLGHLDMMKAIMTAADAKQREAPSDVDSVVENTIEQLRVTSKDDEIYMPKGDPHVASTPGSMTSSASFTYSPSPNPNAVSNVSVASADDGAREIEEANLSRDSNLKDDIEAESSSSHIAEDTSQIPAEWKANKRAPSHPSLWEAMNPSVHPAASPDASPIRSTNFDPHYYSDFEGNNDSYFDGNNDSFVADTEAEPRAADDRVGASNVADNSAYLDDSYYEGVGIDEMHSNHPVESEANGLNEWSGEPSQDYLAALPEGWTEYSSEEGYTYYYNHITGESSWDRPVNASEYKQEGASASTTEVLAADQHLSYGNHGDVYNADYYVRADQSQSHHYPQQYYDQQLHGFDTSYNQQQQSSAYVYPTANLSPINMVSNTASAVPELPRPTGGMKTVVIESTTGNVVPSPGSINIARANSVHTHAPHAVFSPHSPMVSASGPTAGAGGRDFAVGMEYDYGTTPVKSSIQIGSGGSSMHSLPLPSNIKLSTMNAASAPATSLNVPPSDAVSPSAGFFSPMASTPAQHRPLPVDLNGNVRRNLESEMITPPSVRDKRLINNDISADADGPDASNRLMSAMAATNDDSFINYDIERTSDVANNLNAPITETMASGLPSRQRNPSISSLSDDQSEVSSVTNKHLEIWNKFFENALKSGEVNRQRQLLRQFTTNPSDVAERRAKQKRSIKSSKSSKPSYTAAHATTRLDDHGWPVPLDEGIYAELIGDALSKLSTSFDGEELNPSPTSGYALGTVALLAASVCADAPTVEELLSVGVQPSCVDSQIRTPLHHCARLGSVDIASLLLEYEADVDARDVRGQTPLHVACSFGHIDMVRFLLESAAVADTRDDNGGVPMHFAAGGGHVECIKLLHEYGASPIAVDSYGSSVMDVLTSRAPKSAQVQRMVAIMKSWAEDETRRLADARRLTKSASSQNEKPGGRSLYQQPSDRPRSQRGSQAVTLYSSDSDEDVQAYRRTASRSQASTGSRGGRVEYGYEDMPKKKVGKSTRNDMMPPSSRAAEIKRLAAIEKRKTGENADSAASKGVIMLADAVERASRSSSSRPQSKLSDRDRKGSDASAMDNASVNSGGSSVSSRSSQFIDPRTLCHTSLSSSMQDLPSHDSKNPYSSSYIDELPSPPRNVSKYDTFDAEDPVGATKSTRSGAMNEEGELRGDNSSPKAASSDGSNDTPSSALGGVTRAVGGFVWGAASSLIGATMSILTAPRKAESTENNDDSLKGFGPPPPPPTDFELQQRGLGNLPPADSSPLVGASRRRIPIPESPRPPPIVAAELDAYMVAYKKGLTPRRRNLAPPADVAAALAAATKAGASNAVEDLSRPDENETYESIVAMKRPAPLDLAKNPDTIASSYIPAQLDSVPESHSTSDYRPEPPSRYNNYSMGSIPNGVRWRYVDVLNTATDDSHELGRSTGPSIPLKLSPSKKKSSASPRKSASASLRSKNVSPKEYDTGSGFKRAPV